MIQLHKLICLFLALNILKLSLGFIDLLSYMKKNNHCASSLLYYMYFTVFVFIFSKWDNIIMDVST